MTEIVNGMVCADPAACYEFVRRQTRENIAALAAGAALVGDAAFQLECARPDELMAWKFPEHYEAVPGRIFPDAIDAGAQGDKDAVLEQLERLAFSHLATTASAARHLQRSAEYLLNNESARNAPDPQGRLL